MSYDPTDHITGIRRIIETRETRIHDSIEDIERGIRINDYNDVAQYAESAAVEARAVAALRRILAAFEDNADSASKTLRELHSIRASIVGDIPESVFHQHQIFLLDQLHDGS